MNGKARLVHLVQAAADGGQVEVHDTRHGFDNVAKQEWHEPLFNNRVELGKERQRQVLVSKQVAVEPLWGEKGRGVGLCS